MDTVSKEKRSKIMSSVRGKNTKLELSLRRELWRSGVHRYRINMKIKGKPDILFPKEKVAVFIDGCFWHGCPRCYTRPKSNQAYWDNKKIENIARDRRVDNYLAGQGFKVVRLWEHEIIGSMHDATEKIMTALEAVKEET
jgi:DNA mismatch endonuclease (patch repair protein)